MNKVLIKTTTVAFIATFFMSCGSEETSENESRENEITTEEVETTKETEDLDIGIAEDLDNATFKSYLTEKPGLLIDVRTAEEFEGGHIDGAINLDYTSGAFEAALDTLKKDQPVFVYCQAGGRSGKAKELLIGNHFPEVYNLENGYGNWEE